MLSARAEAAIDYAEEDETSVDASLVRDIAELEADLTSWLDRPRVEPLKDGVRVVVAGPPNAGKSSLINAIAGQEKAIVTEMPGTTRDQIEVPLNLNGIPILLTDTAGLRHTSDRVERIGIERARSSVAAAEVLLWLGEPDEAPDQPRSVKLHPRCDLPGRDVTPHGSLAISSVTGAGLSDLLETIGRLAHSLLPAEDALALNRRQALHIAQARSAIAQTASSNDIVLIAESLRSARAAFDRLTGRASVDDVLDALFGRFCLGK
jgi:tRNA modification GTPase